MKNSSQACLKKRLFSSSLCLLLIASFGFKTNANCITQGITLSEKNASLEKIFKSIEKQCGYFFVYNKDQLRQSTPVSIEINHASLEQTLAVCFKDQPFSYSIIDNLIVIKSKKKSFTASLSNLSTGDINVKGRVIDEKGEPIEGVTVSIRGTKIATSTNIRGEFNLQVTDKNVLLIFTGANIEPYSEHVSGRSEFQVKLVLRKSKLDEVIVIPYGSTTERLKVGNITKIKGAEIERQPTGNFLLALEGLVPGLFITQNSGLAGGGVTVRVQGQNSLKNGNDPLYVVDGMPIGSQDLISIGSVLGTSGGTQYGPVSGFGSVLSYINPSDIESVEVLKDASATAIYGSRAANGAILITTKSGKLGKTKIDINLQQGWGKVTRKLDMLNTTQYLAMRREAKANDNAAISATDYDINGVWDSTRYTDWQQTLIGGTSQYTHINAGISGGNNTTQYTVGATWHKETSVFPGSFADQKASIHFNLNCISDNQKFRLQLTGNYMVDNNKLPSADLTRSALVAEPNAPALFMPDGSLNWELNSTGNSTWDNPVKYLYIPFKGRTNNLISSVQLSYRILPGLELKSNIGYQNTFTKNFVAYKVLAATKPENRPTTTTEALYSNGISESWNIEPQLTYKKKIGRSVIDALIGGTILQNDLNYSTMDGTGYPSDNLLENPPSATKMVVLGNITEYRYNAFYGRLNYNWDNKYIIDLTARRDGTSRFGPENQFHNFGAAGAAWIFSEERFFRQHFPHLSFGKLKASYGTTGSDQLKDYAYLNSYSPITGSSNVLYQGITSLSPGGLTNPQIAWEETKKLQVGIDLGFIKDRILLGATYSRNRSSNQLLSYNLPIMTGFTSIFQNLSATVQNSSWELSFNSINFNQSNLRWTTSFNITFPNNKLVDYPGLSSSTFASTYIIGQPVNIIKLYHFLGVDPARGVYTFADSHDNATLSPNSILDKTVIFTPFPKFYGGLQNSFSYKGIQLDISFQFTKQTGPNINYYAVNSPGVFSPGSSNQPVSVLQRWQKPGDISALQKFSTSSLVSAMSTSDAYYVDASYIRLKNLSLSYEFPQGWKRKAHIQGCRIYVTGQNLFTFTRFKGLDPENQSNASLPPLRVLTTGIQLTL